MSAATTLAPTPAERMGGGLAGRLRASGYDRRDLTWSPHPDDSLSLQVSGVYEAILHVVPDAVYPDMYRIKHPDGRLSDLVNLTRAKDAACSMALSMLNVRHRGGLHD